MFFLYKMATSLFLIIHNIIYKALIYAFLTVPGMICPFYFTIHKKAIKIKRTHEINGLTKLMTIAEP